MKQTSIGKYVVADGSTKLRIRCVGYAESSAHYADAVVVSATSLVLSIDGTADTTFSGATGTLLFATYTTLGLLCDEINSSANWEAEIVAGLRSDAVNGSELLARSTSTFRMYEQVNLYADSSDSGVYRIGVLIEPNRAFDTVHGLLSQQVFNQNRVGINRIRALVDTSDSGAADLTVYELKPDKAASLRTVYNSLPADNTEKDTGAVDGAFIQADYGNSLYVVLSDASWQDTGAYVNVQAILEQND
jgi:hypothetical protein